MTRLFRKRMAGFFLLLVMAATAALARDVAFVEPTASGGVTEEAFRIEPKNEVDMGDSVINLARHQSFFFVNQTLTPVKIEKVATSSDSTVTASVVNDDCSKEGTLAPQSRCAIELAVTPTGPGVWGVEILMTHDGLGRISRAKITGKTAGSDAAEHREHGLSLSLKDNRPIDFGDIPSGDGKVVRSALMVNDSLSPITIYAIDVVEAGKSLQRSDTGCAIDMELKPGESCPVTLIWAPIMREAISTDLIIRHSGQLGFTVIPVRGTAKGSDRGEEVPLLPPTPAEVVREAAKTAPPVAAESVYATSVHLIGTVGNRAVLLKHDGTSAIVQEGDAVDLGDRTQAKILSINAMSVALEIGGKRRNLALEAAPSLKEKAKLSAAAASDCLCDKTGETGAKEVR